MLETKSKEKAQNWGKEELERHCPSCKNSTLVKDYQRNTIICENCGMIVEEDMKDRGPEWRSFDQEQKEERSRAGPPSTETIHDKGLSTQIDRKNRDARGKSLPPERRTQMYRLRKWQKRIKVSGAKNRNLATALTEIDRMSSRLSLPKKVREDASKLYRQAVKEDLIRGRSIEGVASSALYAACRSNQIPRTLDEISEVSRVEKNEIARSYRFLTRELEVRLPPIDPARFVSRFGSELNISGETRAKAIEIIKKAQEMKVTSGKSPKGTAAAAVYMASIICGERKSQRDVAEVAGVTEVTIRNRYKEMIDEFDIDIDV